MVGSPGSVCRRKSYAIAHREPSAGSQAEWAIGDAEGETGERAGIAALRKRDERTERHTRLLCASTSSDHGGDKNDRPRIVEPAHEGNSEKGRGMLSSVKAGSNWTMVQHGSPRILCDTCRARRLRRTLVQCLCRLADQGGRVRDL
jgi:hypothetical protein